MQVYGVGKNGGFFGINNDLNVSVEYGDFCYSEPGTGKFVYLIPEKRPKGYKEGAFEFDEDDFDFDEAKYYGKFKISITAELKPNSKINIEKVLKEAMNGATKQYRGNNMFDGADYKVVRNDTSIKAGYFYVSFNPGMGFWFRPYNMQIFTKRCWYSVEGNFTSNDIKKNGKIIENFLKSLKFIEDDVRESNKAIERERESKRKNISQPSFKVPTYNSGTNVDLNYISVTLPDGFEYVTSNHLPTNDSKAENLLKEYEMVAASADCKGKLKNYRDTMLGINITEAAESNIDQVIWNHVDDALAGRVDLNMGGSPIKIIDGGEGYLIGYGKGNECNSDDEPYWVIYFVVVFFGDMQQTCNLYFNSKRTTAKNYKQTIEEFCQRISVNLESAKTKQIENFKHQFGEFASDNGKIDAVVVSQLYTKDVIFHNENEILYDGKRTVVTGFQMNAELIYDYPAIVENSKAFARELFDLFTYVENNKKLKLAKSKTHKELLKATRGFPLTGALVFELCAWHMLLIAKAEPNKYNVAIDNNLIYGIPDAYSYVGEFIKTLRGYNEIYEDFEITFASTINMDSPCDNISKPVEGAAEFESIKKLFVEGEKDLDGFNDSSSNNIIAEAEDANSNKHSKISLDSIKSTVSDIKSFEISDDINVLRVFVNEFEDNWNNAIEESNEEIMSSKDVPITRSNDVRIRKINENTENVINIYATKLQEVMKKLDEIGSELQKNEAPDDSIIKIANLVSECFEKLHIKTSVCAYKEEKEFKYNIDNEFSNISRKWKRIYKALPSVKQQAIKQSIDEKQIELHDLLKFLEDDYSHRDNITREIGELKAEIDSVREKYTSIEGDINYKQEQHDNDINAINESISKCENMLQNASEAVKEKEAEIKSKKADFSTKVKTKKQSKKDLEKKLDELQNHRQILEQDSLTKKTALDKAFLFKKNKRIQYDESLERLRLNDIEIRKCETDINYASSEINSIEKEKEQAIDSLNSELEELKNEKARSKADIDAFKEKKKYIESEVKELNKKLKDTKIELNELEKKLKKTNSNLDIINSSIDEKEKTRDLLQEDIETLNKDLLEI